MEGIEACKQGRRLDDCPYDVDAPELRRAWRSGFETRRALEVLRTLGDGTASAP